MNIKIFLLMALLHVFSKRVYSRTVDITGSTTGFQGTNGTSIECVFTKDNGDLLTAVLFYAKNSSNKFEPIVSFSVRRGHTFFSLWSYLFENVTQELTPVTDSSTAAEILINHLLCKHEREYKCGAAFESLVGQAVPVDSNIINITVQVKSSTPEKIEILNISPVNSLPSTITSDYTGQSFMLTGVNEGDKITFSCTSNVGKPPSRIFWEKVRFDGTIVTYQDNNTELKYVPEGCSYNRTSNVTIPVTAEDNQAILRCCVDSIFFKEDQCTQTGPITVYYKVNVLTIKRYPHQETYTAGSEPIILTCVAVGNPEPKYKWYKKDNRNVVLATSNKFVISNVTTNESGIYICEASNTVATIEYATWLIVEIKITRSILEEKSTCATVLQNTSNIAALAVVSVICGALFIVTMVLIGVVLKMRNTRSNSWKDSKDYVNTKSNIGAVPPRYEGIAMVSNEHQYTDISTEPYDYELTNTTFTQ